MPLLLEWGEEIDFSCVCVAETVLLLLLLLLLLILLFALLLWWTPCICSPPTPHVYSASIRSAFVIRSRRSVVEFFCGNSPRVKAVNWFRRGAPSLMFDGILNVTLSEEKVFTTGVTQGNLELFLRPNSPDSHQTQIQEYEILDWPHVLISLKENSSTW